MIGTTSPTDPMDFVVPTSPEDYRDTAAVRVLDRFIDLTDEEVGYLGDLQVQNRKIEPRSEIIAAGENYEDAFILLSGWAFRFKLLPDGRRQIQNFVLPGDVFGISAALFAASNHSVETLTECDVAFFPSERILDLCTEHPRLSVAVNWLSALHQELMAEHLVSLGRRNAEERVAHLLIELMERLRIAGLTLDNKFRFPLTQEHIADTLGLSIVHVNRTLRSMRAKGLIENGNGQIEIPDVDQLKRIAKFDRLFFDGLRRSVETDPDKTGKSAA